jgi:hypothetical protein
MIVYYEQEGHPSTNYDHAGTLRHQTSTAGSATIISK